ncbi:MAG: ribosome maturation factor RimP [Frankia sp.]
MSDAAGGAGPGASRRSTPRRAGGPPAPPRAVRDRSEGVELAERLAPALAAAGYDLEDVTVGRAGRRSVVRVVVDRDSGINLDAVADASRLVGAVLDADDDVLGGPYVLEVTSPGVDRPLTHPRHWRRATGRLVAVSLTDGRDIVGRVVSTSPDAAQLRLAASGELRVPYDEVTLAVVQVEFTSAKDSAADPPGPADVAGRGADDSSPDEFGPDDDENDEDEDDEFDDPEPRDELEEQSNGNLNGHAEGGSDR